MDHLKEPIPDINYPAFREMHSSILLGKEKQNILTLRQSYSNPEKHKPLVGAGIVWNTNGRDYDDFELWMALRNIDDDGLRFLKEQGFNPQRQRANNWPTRRVWELHQEFGDGQEYDSKESDDYVLINLVDITHKEKSRFDVESVSTAWKERFSLLTDNGVIDAESSDKLQAAIAASLSPAKQKMRMISGAQRLINMDVSNGIIR